MPFFYYKIRTFTFEFSLQLLHCRLLRRLFSYKIHFLQYILYPNQDAALVHFLCSERLVECLKLRLRSGERFFLTTSHVLQRHVEFLVDFRFCNVFLRLQLLATGEKSGILAELKCNR